ncbi:MFS transporter [Nocardia sp. NPDC052112]|uniref:MFS transporter n=1 Tax=Nocardia sp. NPDC052112 TaxID=3155646 RepID=UPI0034165A60
MRLAVFALMLVVFSLTTGEFVIAGILPEVADGLAVSVPAAGLLVSAYALGMIVGGPVVTVATARLPRKPLVVGLVAVAVVANLGSALAPNYSMVLLARFAAGLVVATLFAVAIATVVAMAEPGREAAAVAQVALGLNLGIIGGTPIGAAIGQSFGWRATFVSVVVCVAVALLLVLRFLPTMPAPSSRSVRGELRVFADRRVQLAIGLTTLGNVGVVTVFTYFTPLLTEVSGFASRVVPALLLVYGAGAVLGNYLGGRLADRALMPSLAGLLAALAGTSALLWVFAEIQLITVALIFVLGVLAFAIVPGMQIRVVTAAGAAPTLAIAVNASGYQLAAAFAGRIGGWAIDDGPGLRSIYSIAAVLTVSGSALALHMLRRDRRPALESS